MMHAKAQADIHTRWGDGSESSRERWMALMQCGMIETNDNKGESNGHGEQDKDERERGRE